MGNLLTARPGTTKVLIKRPLTAWQFASHMSDLDSQAYGAPIGALYNHFDSSYFVLTEGRRGVRPTLLHFTPGVPTPTVVDAYDARPELLVLNRFGHVFVSVGELLKRYKVVDDVARPVGQLILPRVPDAAEADDATGDLVLLTKPSTEAGAGRSILRVRADLTLKSAQPLPASLLLPGEGACVVHPKSNELIVGSSGAAALSQIGSDRATGRLYVGRTLAHPALRRIGALQVTDRGQFVVLSEGVVRVFEETAVAGLAPVTDSPWVQTPALGGAQFLTVTRSRHNLDGRHARWLDVAEDFIRAAEVPDCAPDFNLDGVLDATDYEDFLQCHAGARPCPRGRDADYDANGVVDRDDLTHFLGDYAEPPPACVLGR